MPWMNTTTVANWSETPESLEMFAKLIISAKEENGCPYEPCPMNRNLSNKVTLVSI